MGNVEPSQFLRRPAPGQEKKKTENYSAYLHETLGEPYEFDFTAWAQHYGFTKATRKTLKKQDLTKPEKLLLLKLEDIASIGLTVGEKVLFEEAVRRMKEEATKLRTSKAQKQGCKSDEDNPYSCGTLQEPEDDDIYDDYEDNPDPFGNLPQPKEDCLLPRHLQLPSVSDHPTTVRQTSGAALSGYTRLTSQYVQVREYKNLETGHKGLAMIRALYDCESVEKDELSFKKDDLMELLNDKGDWWKARHVDGREGYVPYNFVALDNTMKSMDWFFGTISRPESEQALKADTAGAGSFLVRESLRGNGLVLSVRGPDEDSEQVFHYKIHSDEGKRCYISSSNVFSTVEDLINYHKVQQDLSKETEDEWEIDPSTIIFDETLGAGQFGEVCKGKWKEKTVVAVKKMKETMDPTEFQAEAAIMKKFKDRNLVKLYAVCTKQKPYLIVMEHMPYGSLLDYLRKDDEDTLGATDLIDMAAQVASGMAYLEKNHFIHRDLAARNILVAERNIVKVSDFGFARLLEDSVYNPKQGTKVPFKWTALEVFTLNRFTIKSDVWSFGILLHEIMTKGEIPYCGMSNQTVVDKIKRGYRLPRDESVPERLYKQMLRCWDESETKRPSFESLQSFLVDYFDDDYTYTT
ncbi:hypothetical protein BaRGS_00027861, partial [Batillaria attramentaria]